MRRSDELEVGADVVQGEWVPLLPFAMKIGSDLYHPAHGGDERASGPILSQLKDISLGARACG